MSTSPRQSARTLHEISSSVFWNTALLPLIAVANLLVSVLIRRSFQLESGTYDILMGLSGSILFYSGLGLASSLPKFLPEVQVRAGRQQTISVLGRIAAARMAVLALSLIAMNVWAEPLSRKFGLGENGSMYLHLLSLLIAAKALMDFNYRALESFLAQLAVNALMLVYAICRFALIGLAVMIGGGIAGVITALGASAAIVAVGGIAALTRRLQQLPAEPEAERVPEPTAERIGRFAALTYANELCLYFSSPAFGSPALAAALGGPAPVALFATSFFVAVSGVSLTVSSFRGIYRPLFARLRAAGDLAQFRRAFEVACKAQVLAVVPAGFGLAVMVPDYLTLLYGPAFAAGASVARILVALLFAETVFALGVLVLWVDERYRLVLMAQATLVLGAPLFIVAAAYGGLETAAYVLGGSRLAASLIGYRAARRVYGVAFPWRFAARVSLASAAMAAVLQLIRLAWTTSPIEASTLTVLGVLLIAAALRVFRILGPDELGVLERVSIPGRKWVVNWLAR